MNIYSNLSEECRFLLDKVRQEEDVPILSHTLTNPQRIGTKASTAIAFSLIAGSALVTPEMGLGKTYIAMGIIREILKLNPNKKVIFCGPNDKLIEFKQDFEFNLPEYKVVSTSASEREVQSAFVEMDRGGQILICGHSVFNKGVDFHLNLIPTLDNYVGFVLDEGGMLLKSEDSYAYRSMVEFVPNMKYKYTLNATPIERDLTLLINQCRVLGIPIPSRSKIYREFGTSVGEHKIIFNDLDQLKEKMRYHMFNVSRSELDIAGKINLDVRVSLLPVPNPLFDWIKENGVRHLRYPFFDEALFREDYYPSLRTLKTICSTGKSEGDKMLVYIRNVAPKRIIKRELEKFGLSVGIYDGTHTNNATMKKYVEDCFNAGKYDVLLTNKLYGLSLPIVNHVVMYDLPPNFPQYIFRAIRTLDEHDIKLTAIVYDHPRDMEYLSVELNSERYQNEFVDRGFNFVQKIVDEVKIKREVGHYY